ncbi:MAG: PaaI family thioesterase, partial [Bacteroidales bacterium]
MPQRRKVRNPFDPDQNLCFGCGPANPAGLKLTFEEDEEKLYAEWQPSAHFQGYTNVLHGGIIATLLDETGAWCVNVKAGTSG